MTSDVLGRLTLVTDGRDNTTETSHDASGRMEWVEDESGNRKAEYGYDYLGRRIEKRVWTYASGWDLTEHRKFIYDGWRMLLELDGLDSDAVLRQYTWGRDLSGSRSGAGGTLDTTRSRQGQVSGLLAGHDADEDDDYVYFYDAQGNVGQVVDLAAGTASAAMVVKYAWDPYGRRTNDPKQDEYEPIDLDTGCSPVASKTRHRAEMG